MIKKTNKYKILITFLTFSVLFSCNYNKTKQNSQFDDEEYTEFVFDSSYYHPIKYNDLGFLIELTIENVLNRFPDSIKLSIFPLFYGGIDKIDIFDNLSEIKGKDTIFIYKEVELVVRS